MTHYQDNELALSMSRAHTACKIIRVISIICLVSFCVIWCLYAIMLLQASIINDSFGTQIPHCIIFGVSITLILASVSLLFSDAVRLKTPFTSKQHKRLAIISAMLLLLAVNDVFFPANELLYFPAATQYIGFEVSASNGIAAPTLNIGMIFFSMLMLCLSVIFRYGYLLQQLSDETV